MAELLDRPSTARLDAMTVAARAFLRTEAGEILPGIASAGYPGDRVEALAASHGRLVDRVDAVDRALAGTHEFLDCAHGLRHELLHHTELYCELRLPRGALIPGGG